MYKITNGQKRKLYSGLLKFGIIMVLLLLYMWANECKSKASESTANDYKEPKMIRTTCYLPTGNPCATGVMPQEGITVAGKREWFGMTCILYQVKKDGSLGKMIGMYEVQDTGGYYIRNGLRIDVYRSNMKRAKAWIKKYGDYTYMQLLKSKG